MNTLHLKYAVEVERTGSITQAAENLYMAQPNLSKAIRELEEQLGFAIFERTSKGVVPTPRGRQALKSAHRVLEELEKMRLLSRCAQARRRFSAVIPRDGYIAEGFARFAAAQDSREDIDLKVKEANAMEAIACVAEGSFALGVIRYPVRSQRYFLDFLQEKGLSHDAVWEFEPLLLMNARHPLAARETIYCADLRPYIQIVQGDAAVPYLAGEPRDQEPPPGDKRIVVFQRATQLELLTRMDAAYMWAAPASREGTDRCQLVQRPCADPPSRYRDALIYPQRYQLTQLDKDFMDKLFQARNQVAYGSYE